MKSLHQQIVTQMEIYSEESQKFDNGNKAAGTRARKALNEMAKLAKERRKEIQEVKNAQ